MVRPTLRRSSRMRSSKFESLDQSMLLGGTSTYDNFLITEANKRLRSSSRVHRSDDQRTRVRIERDSEDEEMSEVYSNPKRNRQESGPSRRNPFIDCEAVEAPPTEDSSSQSNTGEVVNGDIVKASQTTDESENSDSKEEEEQTEEEEETINPRQYFLRQHKPVAQPFQYQNPPGQQRFRPDRSSLRRHRRNRRVTSDSSSSGSDGENPPGSPIKRGGHHSRQKAVPNADIQPIHVDPTVTFESVGGLKEHIKSLQEMVVFPLLYPEFFKKFQLAPPRGVLFCGPPGTGKTLLARALASECSKGSRKIAFYMRKGADCLNKWVGESERQLRLLFEKAQETRPSIIFFDELDGLAPVRSSRQDQIHSSMVSTLLALMDGIGDREDVVVIGATNRVDAIDPALRRPGRFDRELHFQLPDRATRMEIITIATSSWVPQPTEEFLLLLADKTVGFCGADLKAICAESALLALRRRYPQIYGTSDRYKLDFDSIVITEADFDLALSNFSSATSRTSYTEVKKISPHLSSLLGSKFAKLSSMLPPVGSEKRFVGGRRIIICGDGADHGQTSHLAPALLYSFDSLPIFSLALPELFQGVHRTPEEVVAELLSKARKSSPCVIYMPIIESWLNAVSHSVWATFKTCLSTITPSVPITIVATSHQSYDQLDPEVACIFDSATESFSVTFSGSRERRQFFTSIFDEVLRVKPLPDVKIVQLEKLPLLPPPSPKPLSPEQLQMIEENEDEIFADLRMFLREMLGRLMRNSKFRIFNEPVDYDEVPDYLEIIEKPMDLATMMNLIDEHKYQTVEDFMEDIQLIKRNALEYNPLRTADDRNIRHRANNLVDGAYSLIKGDINPAFAAKCRAAKQARLQRQAEAKELKSAERLKAKPIQHGAAADNCPTGLLNSHERNTSSLSGEVGDSGGKKSRCKVVAKRRLNMADGEEPTKSAEKIDEDFNIMVDKTQLEGFARGFAHHTGNLSLYKLESIYFTLTHHIQTHINDADKSALLQQFQAELDKLQDKTE